MSRHHSGSGIGCVSLAVAVGLAASACGGTISGDGTSALFTTPSAATSVAGLGLAGESSRTLAREVITYTLANGTFTITTEKGALTGTYTGVVTDPTSGRPTTVTMTLQVTRGSNVFAGATGTLVGDGKGEFLTAGGSFVLSLEGVVRTSTLPAGSTFQTKVAGTATLAQTCSANDHIISRLRGEGTSRTLGLVRVALESEIIETRCFED